MSGVSFSNGGGRLSPQFLPFKRSSELASILTHVRLLTDRLKIACDEAVEVVATRVLSPVPLSSRSSNASLADDEKSDSTEPRCVAGPAKAKCLAARLRRLQLYRFKRLFASGINPLKI